MQIAKSAYETETKHEYAKHSVAIGFLFVCSWEECRFPISESPKEKKQKEYNAKHSGAISFLFVFSISYVFVVCFFGMFPCCVIFALFMIFCFHQNAAFCVITIDLRWSLVADEVNKESRAGSKPQTSYRGHIFKQIPTFLFDVYFEKSLWLLDTSQFLWLNLTPQFSWLTHTGFCGYVTSHKHLFSHVQPISQYIHMFQWIISTLQLKPFSLPS